MELTVHVELDDVLKLIQQLPEGELSNLKAEIEKRQQQAAPPDPLGER